PVRLAHARGAFMATLTISDAARRCGCPRSTLQRAVCAGRLHLDADHRLDACRRTHPGGLPPNSWSAPGARSSCAAAAPTDIPGARRPVARHAAHHGAIDRNARDLRPTVCLDVISLVAGSCGYTRGEIEPRVAHEFPAHVATQRGRAERPQHRHPPRAQ